MLSTRHDLTQLSSRDSMSQTSVQSMPDALKRFISGTVVEISSSVEEGLPFVTTKYMEFLIKGVLAAAAHLYSAKICHLIVMGNHFHLLAVVENPEHLKDFVGYFKGELAHAVNRLRNSSGKLWEEGFYSAVILTPQDVIDRIAYIYANPAKADLVVTIGEYPGVSTFSGFMENLAPYTETCRRVCRPAIPVLPKRALTVIEDEQLCERFRDSAGFDHELTIDPWAWLNCFEECIGWNREKIREDILRLIGNHEHGFAIRRKTPVRGAVRLRMQNPHRPYSSKRSGKKMICICHIPEMRQRFIVDFHASQRISRLRYKQWRTGEISSYRPPPGFFAPGGALLSNIPFLGAVL